MTANIERARAIIQEHSGRHIRIALDGDAFADGYLADALVRQESPAGVQWLAAVCELRSDAAPDPRSWWAMSSGPNRALGLVRHLPIGALDRIEVA